MTRISSLAVEATPRRTTRGGDRIVKKACGRQQFLLPGRRQHFRPRTTDSRHLCPVVPNPLAERLPSTRPGKVWQADITDVATREGWLYVADVIDACSRWIVGRTADDTMTTSLVARAFERAVAVPRPASGLLRHSDRDSQYASDAYRDLLRRHGVIPSMSRAGIILYGR